MEARIRYAVRMRIIRGECPCGENFRRVKAACFLILGNVGKIVRLRGRENH